MERSQYTSFEEFLKISKSLQDEIALSKINSNELDELLKAFVVNPEKYLEHTNAIYSFKMMHLIYAPFHKFLKTFSGKVLLFFVGNRIKKRIKPFYDQYIENLEKLRAEFKDLVPCELKIALLPTKILETPVEWERSGEIIHLLEIRIAINPEHQLMPINVAINFSVDKTKNVQFIDLFPTTDFEKTGESEVGVTTEGKFVSRSNNDTKVGLGLKGTVGSLDVGHARSKETEKSSSEKYSYNFKYINSTIRVLSDAVGQTANWKFFRTNNGIPIGGMSFHLNMLAPETLKEIDYNVALTVELEKFGEVKSIQSDVLKLSTKATPASNLLLK